MIDHKSEFQRFSGGNSKKNVAENSKIVKEKGNTGQNHKIIEGNSES